MSWNRRSSLVVVVGIAMAGLAAPASAQQAPTSPWSVEFGIGWDNSISGNINSGAVGRINNQAVVILKNRYEDVYGTGLHLRFGGGYLIDEVTEIIGIFTFQSLDADLTPMGDIGVSRLYAQYDDYQSLGLDFGLRRYVNASPVLRAYADAGLGIAFVDKTTIQLIAPTSNAAFNVTDFYDRTAAFTLQGNAGLLWSLTERFGVFGQLGVRYVTGMSDVDQLEGTDLDTINDKSARWTVPFVFGIRARF